MPVELANRKMIGLMVPWGLRKGTMKKTFTVIIERDPERGGW
jgi:hypothetical protein